MIHRLGWLPALLATACLWASGPELEPVDESEVLQFAERIEGFYRALERVPLDVGMTFRDETLRAHFNDEDTFADYYASLADQVRAAAFRNGRTERIDILSFRFEEPETARVELTLVGRHQRGLRFWQITLPRTDTWRLREGAWVVSPERL
jgi:hypothetical protein